MPDKIQDVVELVTKIVADAVLSASVDVPEQFPARVDMRETITRNTVAAILTALLSHVEEANREREAPRPYPHWNGAGKVTETFIFEGGTLAIKTSGHDPDGDGHMIFAEDGAEWHQAEDSTKVYRVVNVPNSDLIFLRDKLNEVFPPALDREVQRLRGALEEGAAALTEAEAIMGGEYASQHQGLFDRIAGFRETLTALKETEHG